MTREGWCLKFVQQLNLSSFHDHWNCFIRFRNRLIRGVSCTSNNVNAFRIEMSSSVVINWSYTVFQGVCILHFIWDVRLGRLNTRVVTSWWCLLWQNDRIIPIRCFVNNWSKLFSGAWQSSRSLPWSSSSASVRIGSILSGLNFMMTVYMVMSREFYFLLPPKFCKHVNDNGLSLFLEGSLFHAVCWAIAVVTSAEMDLMSHIEGILGSNVIGKLVSF